MTVMLKDAQSCLLVWAAKHLGDNHALKSFCDEFTLICQSCSSKRRSSMFSEQQSTAA